MGCFLKEIENMLSVFLPTYRNTHESSNKLWKQPPAGSCSHSISRSPNFHSCFCSLRETRYIQCHTVFFLRTQKNTYTGVVALLPISLICTRFAWHSSSSSSNEFRMPNFSTMASHWNFFSCKKKYTGKKMSFIFHCNIRHLHTLCTHTSKLLTSNNKQVRCRRDDRRAASGVELSCDILSSSCLVSELWLVHDFKTTPMSVVSCRGTRLL